MTSSEQLGKQAFSLIDKNLYERLYFGAVDVNTVETYGGSVLIGLLVLSFVLFLYFDRDNGYTRGHHSRQNGAFWLAIIVVFTPFFVFKPSAESVEKTRKSLERRMAAVVPIAIADKIKREGNLVEKLSLIVDAVDSSGRLYYITSADSISSVDANSKKFGNNIHHYPDPHNYQKEYISGLKSIEGSYTGQEMNTAKFLYKTFHDGNLFVVKNKTKAAKYKSDIDALKKKDEDQKIAAQKELQRLQSQADEQIETVKPQGV